jgi:hypothetical protein
MMTTRTVPAADLHIGDLVVPPVGPPRRVTLHRLQGATPVAVIGYAGQADQQSVPVSELFTVLADKLHAGAGGRPPPVIGRGA